MRSTTGQPDPSMPRSRTRLQPFIDRYRFVVLKLPRERFRNAFGSPVLRNPMTPGLLTWVLLFAAHLLGGDISSPLTFVLAGTGLVFLALFVVLRRAPVPLPWVPEREVQLFLLAALGIFALEAVYARGLPVLGSAEYTEFGLPVLHHVVFSLWVLPLIAPRRPALYLAAALGVGIAMFSRQLIILAVISYLMRVSLRNVGFMLVVGVGVVALGSLRNTVLGVEEVVGQAGELVGGPLGHLLFWVYLYLLGPYSVSFGNAGLDTGPVEVANYWNTLPDWYLLTRVGLPAELALVAFYSVVALMVVLLTRLRSFEARMFGTCMHLLCYMTFFSNTLLSTPVIGTFLVIIFIHRGQQIARPQSQPAVASVERS